MLLSGFKAYTLSVGGFFSGVPGNLQQLLLALVAGGYENKNLCSHGVDTQLLHSLYFLYVKMTKLSSAE